MHFLTVALLCLPPGHALAQEPRTETSSETPHWRVHLLGTEEEARDLGAALEAAVPQFERVVGAKLPRKQAGPVPVYVHEDRESWLLRIRTDGEEPASVADPVYYSAAVDAVYVYRGFTEYITRSLALHGAFQRFHCKVRPKHEDMLRTWVVIGLADHLSVHQWDGETLRLGALPIVTMIDYPALVTQHMARDRFNPDRLFEEGLNDRLVCFALVRSVMQAASTKKSFQKLILGHTGSKLAPAEFARQLGNPRDRTAALLEWFEQNQQPFQPIYGIWEDRGAGALRVRPHESALSLAISKAPLEELSAALPPPADSKTFVGLVFGYQDEGSYWVAGRRGDRLVVEEHGGTFRHAVPAPSPAIAKRPVEVYLHLDEGRARVLFDGELAGMWDAPGEKLGFFCLNGPADLHAVRWR